MSPESGFPESGPHGAEGASRIAYGRRVVWTTLAVVVIAAGSIWLLVFDMWLGQVERQYLWENARHELRLGPAVSLKAMMDDARVTGAWVATAWSLLVAIAIAFAAWYAHRQGARAGRYADREG